MYDLLETPNYSSTTFPEPRPFQVAAHESLRRGFLEGHKNQLLMAPTGAGKTYLGLRIAYEALAKGKRALFVCDRTTLIDQTSVTADSYGLGAHGIVQAKHWKRNDMPFQICSAQTIAKREYWPQADVIIVDEAHTQLKVWTEYIQTTKAACIGLSATPFSKGLGKLFTNLINATTMHDLTKSGVLVPLKIFTCTRADMTGAATAGGEWTDNAAAEREMAIIGDVVTEWHKYGENRKTIIFAANIAHCKELSKQFIDSGVYAAVFTSETTTADRKILLDEYRKPDSELKILISVEALAKGFDVPDVGCVVDCRPLRKSLSTAIQMWGRGLRASLSTGKQDCILLDHSGNIVRFQEDFEQIFFNGLDALDMGEKLDKAIRNDPEEYEPKGCPVCSFKPFVKRCISCGFEHIAKPNIEVLPGHMKEVVLNGKKLANDEHNLYNQIATYSRAHGNPATQSKRTWHLFQKITGHFPTQYKFEFAPNVPVSRNVENKIKSLNIAYFKMRSAA